MKRAIVVTLMCLMMACVLPMAQAQPQHESVSTPSAPVAHQVSEPPPAHTSLSSQGSDSFEQQMDRLRQQMEQLRQQMEQLARQREQLAKQQEQWARQQENLAKQMAEMSIQRAHLAGQAAGGTGLFQTYKVQEGDTLAKIAEKVAGGDKAKVEETITQIKEANHLDAADSLKAGQRLWVPARVTSPEAVDPVAGVSIPHVPGGLPEGPMGPHVPQANVFAPVCHTCRALSR